jgi:hypothetical protein
MPQDKGIGFPENSLEEFKGGTNHLFAIGINAYEHFMPLSNARKDIEDISKVLVENYYFEPQNIRLLCDEEATKDNIIDELDNLRKKVKSDDRLLIYYSGHGFTDEDRGFWIPVNAKRDKVSSYLANAEVRDIIQSIKARHILLISDSCFSASLLVRDATRDINGAFTEWERNPSRWVFISGKGVVSDGKAGTNSPFASSILNQLRQNDDDALNIVRLADRVTQEVRFDYEQQADISPLYQVGHKGGQFVFLKRQTEKDEWEAALSKNTEGGYLTYLDKYPNGLFEKEAEQKLFFIADEREWKNTHPLNAAFAYRQYLRKYPTGKYVSEANAQLALIAETERREREAVRLEQERFVKIKADREEQEHLAKIKADKVEHERLAKLEADRKEQQQLSILEADRKEQEGLIKEKAEQLEPLYRIERLENEQLSKVEVDRKEHERLAGTPEYRKEQERLIKEKADQLEPLFRRERLQIEHFSKVEVDKKDQERLAIIEADRKNNPLNENAPLVLTFEQLLITHKFRIVAISIIFVSFSIWLMTTSNNPQLPVKNPTEAKPAFAVDTPIIKQNENKEPNFINIEKDKPFGNRIQNNDKQIQADKTAAKEYLETASSFITAEEYGDALKKLEKAKNLSTLPDKAKNTISNAIAFIKAEEYKDAKDAITKALNTIN